MFSAIKAQRRESLVHPGNYKGFVFARESQDLTAVIQGRRADPQRMTQFP